jgi:hypothetical protein
MVINMPPVSPSEQAIAQLCAKVIAVQDCEGFEEAVQSLRVALHEHLVALRDKVADLAFVVAAEDQKTEQLRKLESWISTGFTAYSPRPRGHAERGGGWT